MGNLIFYGIVLVAIASGYGYWHHSVYSEGEQAGIDAQVRADKVIVAKLTLDRDTARASADSCEAAQKVSDAAIDRARNAAREAQARADKAIADAASKSKAAQKAIDDARRSAAQPSTGGKNEICDAANVSLGDALRQLRQ